MSYGGKNTGDGLRQVKVIIVLDSKEYILYLNKKSSLVERILVNENVNVYINELIVREVLRNIKEDLKREFYELLFKSNIFVFHETLPLLLLQKYQKLGLKKGGIVIAAFCEHVKASCLVTENRHFLKAVDVDCFRVIGLKRLCDNLKAGCGY